MDAINVINGHEEDVGNVLVRNFRRGAPDQAYPSTLKLEGGALLIVWVIFQCLPHMPQFWPKSRTFAVVSAVRNANADWGMCSKGCNTMHAAGRMMDGTYRMGTWSGDAERVEGAGVVGGAQTRYEWSCRAGCQW